MTAEQLSKGINLKMEFKELEDREKRIRSAINYFKEGQTQTALVIMHEEKDPNLDAIVQEIGINSCKEKIRRLHERMDEITQQFDEL